MGSDGPAQHRHGLGRFGIQVADFRIQRALAREDHQPRRQIGPHFCRLKRIRDQGTALFQRFGHFQKFEVPDHDGQQIVEIMGNATRHLADCVHPLRPRGGFFGGFSARQIMQDAHKGNLPRDVRAADGKM